MSLSGIAILLFAGASYLIGFHAIFESGYRPKLFTRIVFLLLALNNLASVIKLGTQSSTVVLAWVGFFGSLLILIGALIFKGERLWGTSERVAAVLLVASLLVWIFTDIPIINLLIGLIAHFIGSLPTLTRVVRQPESENVPFWLLFAIASVITLLSTSGGNVKDYVYAIYFCLFDGALTLLSARKYLKRKSAGGPGQPLQFE